MSLAQPTNEQQCHAIVKACDAAKRKVVYHGKSKVWMSTIVYLSKRKTTIVLSPGIFYTELLVECLRSVVQALLKGAGFLGQAVSVNKTCALVKR